MHKLLPTGLLFASVILSCSAQADNRDVTLHSITSRSCRTHFACPDNAELPIQALVQEANTCMTQNFGYPAPDGFFDETYGLDVDNCLTAKDSAIQDGSHGDRYRPSCCITEAYDHNGCVLVCASIVMSQSP